MMRPVLSTLGEEKEGAKRELLPEHRAGADEVTTSAQSVEKDVDGGDAEVSPIRLIAISAERDPECVLAPGDAVTPPGTPRCSMTEGSDAKADSVRADEDGRDEDKPMSVPNEHIGQSCPRRNRHARAGHARRRRPAQHVRVRSSSFSKVLPDLSASHTRSGSMAGVTSRRSASRRHRHPNTPTPGAPLGNDSRYYTTSSRRHHRHHHDVRAVLGSGLSEVVSGHGGIEAEGSLMRRLRIRRALLRRRKRHPLTHSLIGYVILAALWGLCAFIIVVFDIASLAVHRSHQLHMVFNVLSFIFYGTYIIVLTSTFVMTIYDGARLHDHILRHRSVPWEFWRSLFHALRVGGVIFIGVALFGLVGKIVYLALDWGILFFYFFVYNFLAVGVALAFEGVVVYGLASGKVDGVKLVRLGGLCSKYGGRRTNVSSGSNVTQQYTPSGLCGSFWCMFCCGVNNAATETYMLMNNIPIRGGGRSVRSHRDAMPQYVVDEQFLSDPTDTPVTSNTTNTTRITENYTRLEEVEEDSEPMMKRKVVPPPIPSYLRNKREERNKFLQLHHPKEQELRRAKKPSNITSSIGNSKSKNKNKNKKNTKMITTKHYDEKKRKPKKGHGVNKYRQVLQDEDDVGDDDDELVFIDTHEETETKPLFDTFGKQQQHHKQMSVSPISKSETKKKFGLFGMTRIRGESTQQHSRIRSVADSSMTELLTSHAQMEEIGYGEGEQEEGYDDAEGSSNMTNVRHAYHQSERRSLFEQLGAEEKMDEVVVVDGGSDAVSLE